MQKTSTRWHKQNNILSLIKVNLQQMTYALYIHKLYPESIVYDIKLMNSKMDAL